MRAGSHQSQDCSDVDTELPDLIAKAIAKRHGGRLGATVAQQMRNADLAADRRNVYDPALAAHFHRRKDRERCIDCTPEHDRHRAFKVLYVQIFKWRDHDFAGIIDENVYLAKVGADGVYHRLDAGDQNDLTDQLPTARPSPESTHQGKCGTCPGCAGCSFRISHRNA